MSGHVSFETAQEMLNALAAKERELAEAREQIAAYQVRVDNDALRLASNRIEAWKLERPDED